MNIKLYYHKTDGGAEYLMDKCVVCPNGQKEGIFKGANYIVRIDGNIRKDAELSFRNEIIEELQDKLSRRNMQIKELKKRIKSIKDTISNFGVTTSEKYTKIIEIVNR